VRLRTLIGAAVWLLPAGSAKNRALRRLGHRIDRTAVVRPSLVLRVGRVTMAPRSRIGRWNLFKDLSEVSLDEGATIGRFNLVSSHPVYRRLYRHGARLTMGPGSKITSRHQLDCSGSMELGALSSIAGQDTRVLSHSVDLRRDAQAAWPVVIGERSFVGARCLILGGAELPPRSVLAAGSVLPRAREPRSPGLWAGAPAALRGPVDGAWFDRVAGHTRRVFDPSSGEVVEDAF